MHIESSTLEINLPAALLWRRDVEENSVATVTFETPAGQLAIMSEAILQQFRRFANQARDLKDQDSVSLDQMFDADPGTVAVATRA